MNIRSSLRKVAALSGLVLLAVGVFVWRSSLCPSSTPPVTVHMTDEGFSPKEVSVPRCAKVTFISDQGTHWPASDPHPTHYVYAEFDSLKPVPEGQSWGFIFREIGSWKCHDHIHPTSKCVVKVTE